MSNWTDIANSYDDDPVGPAVLVTMGAVKGSTPRDTGANMLVTASKCYGTIGGGRLEFMAVNKAREILTDDGKASEILTLPLGPELAQCCGGHVDILLGRLDAESIQSIFNRLNDFKKKFVLLLRLSQTGYRHQIVADGDSTVFLDKPLQAAVNRRRQSPGTEILRNNTTEPYGISIVQSLHETEFNVTLFGAGHVGRAVVNALSPLPCHIDWIDSRKDQFPGKMPRNVTAIVTEEPGSVIADRPDGSYFLVMTHSHQIDLEICEKLLASQEKAALIGLIGSKTKKAKFDKRLAMRGFDAATIARITCPIGLPGLEGKRPAEIALSVATDLLLRHQSARAETSPVRRGEIGGSS